MKITNGFKKALFLLSLSLFLSSIQAAPDQNQAPEVQRPSTSSQVFVDEDGTELDDDDFGEDIDNPEGLDYFNKMVYLDAIQKHFWNPKRKLQDNNINILHRDGDTHMIRTRYAMTTTIILDNDKIVKMIAGDTQGFEIKELGKEKWDLSNMITIRPKLIGIDTNITLIGESGTIYTFYVFSTHFTNRRNPALSVFVSKKRPIGKIAMTNLEEEEQYKKAYGEKRANSTGKVDSRRIPYAIIEEDDGEFITIGDTINKLHIDKSKIQRGYAQFPRSLRSWKTLGLVKKATRGAVAMMAIDIFNDNNFTYFKFDRETAASKFPTIFKVVDKYDNPVNVRVVGNYIIAEDLSDKWTLRMGDEYVCVQRIEKPLIITRYDEFAMQQYLKEQKLKQQENENYQKQEILDDLRQLDDKDLDDEELIRAYIQELKAQRAVEKKVQLANQANAQKRASKSNKKPSKKQQQEAKQAREQIKNNEAIIRELETQRNKQILQNVNQLFEDSENNQNKGESSNNQKNQENIKE